MQELGVCMFYWSGKSKDCCGRLPAGATLIKVTAIPLPNHFRITLQTQIFRVWGPLGAIPYTLAL